MRWIATEFMSRRRRSRIITLIIMQDGTFSEITIMKKRSHIQAEAWKGLILPLNKKYRHQASIPENAQVWAMELSVYQQYTQPRSHPCCSRFKRGRKDYQRFPGQGVFICSILNADPFMLFRVRLIYVYPQRHIHDETLRTHAAQTSHDQSNCLFYQSDRQDKRLDR